MSYYPQPDGHIRDKAKVVLNVTNYATEKELEHASGVETSDLTVKKYFLLWKLKLINYTLINCLMFQLVWLI